MTKRLPAELLKHKKITERDKQVFLENVEKGMTIKQAGEAAAHPVNSFYKLMQRDQDFREAYNLAKEIGTDTIEQEAYRRGVEGFEKPVWGKVAPGIDGQIGTEIAYSDKLLEVMLKGRRQEYRDNPRVDITNQTLNVSVEDKSAALSDVAKVLMDAGANLGAITQNGGGDSGDTISDPSLLLAESE